ncbi:MAG TPA: hypothetical protein VG099_20570 [Gemmataceae bacterium]|jgi:hypothetical protein|nr:hypothetical protein [Gemmataceae bacterium]
MKKKATTLSDLGISISDYRMKLQFTANTAIIARGFKQVQSAALTGAAWPCLSLEKAAEALRQIDPEAAKGAGVK